MRWMLALSLATASLLPACSLPSNSPKGGEFNGMAAFSAASMFARAEASLNANARMTRSQIFAMVGKKTFAQYYADLDAVLTDAPLIVNGTVLTDAKKHLREDHDSIMALDGMFADLRTMWLQIGADPEHTTAASMEEALQAFKELQRPGLTHGGGAPTLGLLGVDPADPNIQAACQSLHPLYEKKYGVNFYLYAAIAQFNGPEVADQMVQDNYNYWRTKTESFNDASFQGFYKDCVLGHALVGATPKIVLPASTATN